MLNCIKGRSQSTDYLWMKKVVQSRLHRNKKPKEFNTMLKSKYIFDSFLQLMVIL